MIILEILFYLALIAAAIYFAFFSKFAQRAAKSAEKRNADLSKEDTPDALAARASAIETEKQNTSAAIAARKAAVAQEAAKLDQISVK
jgi:flagellar basal body-associated protein FliL